MKGYVLGAVYGERVVREGGWKRGPRPTGTYFDELDLAPHLRPGAKVLLLAIVLLLPGMIRAADLPVEAVLCAADFGLVGDGVQDNGPALQRAIEAMRQHAPPVKLRFDAGKTYRVKSAADTWVFSLKGLRNFTLEGNGATFVIDPHLRFILLNSCTNAVVRGFSLDFDPLPFADGVVVAKDAAAKTVDVKIGAEFTLPPLGGPTGKREQAFFAMLWHQKPQGLIGEHYFIADTQEAFPGSLKDRIIRARAASDFNNFAGIRAGETRISLPVRGVAHKVQGFGASPAVVIEENQNVCFENINVWSAPLFAVNVARNRGFCVFRHFDIRPQPGRLTSSWRDGFHVKGNYASLLWEDCRLEGMNDDAFNTATHSSSVVEVLGPETIRVRQNFPLGFVPFVLGDTLVAYDTAGGKLLGHAKVIAVVEEARRDTTNPECPAVPVKLTPDHALPGLRQGDVAWNESSANPHTIIRRCIIRNSCRFQSPVTVEDCDITAFCWFYGDNIEGPLPANVTIQNCRLRAGRGNPQMVGAFTSLISGTDGKPVTPTQPVIFNVRLEGNTIDGILDIGYVENLSLVDNLFVASRGRLSIHDSRAVLLKDNYFGINRLDHVEQIEVRDIATQRAITIENHAISRTSALRPVNHP